MPEHVERIIQSCNKETVKECLRAVRKLDPVEYDILMRVFEFSPRKRFNKNLRTVLNYLIK